MKKSMSGVPLLLCMLVLNTACNNSVTNVPVAASESSAVIPNETETETPTVEETVDAEEEKVLEYIVAGDTLPLIEEKCELSKYPLISLKRKYDRVKFLYHGNNEFDFKAEGYADPFDDNNYQNAEYILGMKMKENIFTLINNQEDVPGILYFDMMLLGSWNLKSIDKDKMILTANVFGDQCNYTFGVPALHYSDKDGDKVEDKFDCAPEDKTKWQKIQLHLDQDGDGIGGEEVELCIGYNIEGSYTEEAGDCDDTNPDKIWEMMLFHDQDGDGYRSSNSGENLFVCYDQSQSYENYTTNEDMDCDDSNANVAPNLDEIFGDGLDNNCDGVTGEEVPEEEENLVEQPEPNSCGIIQFLNGECSDPYGSLYNTDTDNDSVADMLDCAPTDANAFEMLTFYGDQDRDGFGDPTDTRTMCVGSEPRVLDYTLNSGDCDDTDLSINPSMAEIVDGKDNNCDAYTDNIQMSSALKISHQV